MSGWKTFETPSCRAELPRGSIPIGGTMRPSLVVVALSALVAPARAQSLEIHGKTGYMGEYELSSTVSRQTSNEGKEYSGPLTVRHVGLCTRDGPKESVGEIRLQLSSWSSRVTATLEFDGSKCTYKGFLSESYHGFMDCSDASSLPLRLWTK
jgi:hypothetical protein